MNIYQITFVWIVASIGFGMGAAAVDEEAPDGHHFLAGIVTAVLSAALAYQIIA